MKTPKKRIYEKYSSQSYWDFVQAKSTDSEGSVVEPIEANPDALGEDSQQLYLRGPRATLALQIICDAVDALPDDLRAVYIRYFRESASQQQIANELNVSHMTISRQIKKTVSIIEEYSRSRMSELEEI